MVDFSAYGLDRNPFTIRLDPLAESGHAHWFVRVDGFQKLDRIDTILASALASPEPLVFLVSGRNGTGRTAVANYILGRYRDMCGIARERFVVPDQPHTSHDEFTTLKNWLIFLKNAVEELSPLIRLPDEILAEINMADRETFVSIFQGVLRKVGRVMRNATPPAGFGFLLEDVPTCGFVSAARTLFSKSKTVCVFTVPDYQQWQTDVIDPFKRTAGPDHIVELSPLGGWEVSQLVDARWAHHSNSRSPFAAAHVEQAFGEKSRPVARVLSLVASLLELKLARRPRGVNSRWPEADDLAFSDSELCAMVQTLERRL